jgi:hypothetical protein
VWGNASSVLLSVFPLNTTSADEYGALLPATIQNKPVWRNNSRKPETIGIPSLLYFFASVIY